MITFGPLSCGLVLNLGITVDGQPLGLTSMESIVLRTLVAKQADSADAFTTHKELSDAVAEKLPKAPLACSNVLQVIVSRIRRKLITAESGISVAVVRRKGYRLVKRQVAP